MPDLHLGLIGDNIKQSSTPRLHRLAGLQNGLDVQYDSLIPPEMNKTFDQVFDACQSGSYRGINITYPYKEIATQHVEIEDAQVRRIGAINTVVFSSHGPRGYNTDYSGFLDAYRKERGHMPPDRVLLVGTGGVGRAIAFGLLTLGARDIRLTDCDPERAHGLASDLRAAAPAGTNITVGDTVDDLAQGVEGLVNCTPVGMVGYGGTAIPTTAMRDATWAFDAVYTPIHTQFLREAAQAGLQVISGYELFFFQGVNAWDIFAGHPLDQALLRADLNAPAPAPL
ncbi:shikimate dehydrogenase family protein [Celeribacter sp.]|uniref:shikimate dehydrogenase family protein n=1 Tax=Celeribacter sp. TaxID=1890673 RepID=UPI003A8CCD93